MRAALLSSAFLLAAVFTRLAATEPPPIGLALSLNDSASSTAFRGWPLVLGGQVYLKAGATAALTVDPEALRLVIESSGGGAAVWPVRRAVEPTAPVSLLPPNSVAKVSWILGAEESRGLAVGDYSARLEWAGRKSPPVRITIADEPPAMEARAMARKVRLLSEAALLLGDTAGALAALDGAGADSVVLLLQRARVQERRGDAAAMLAAAQRALEIFDRDAPDADHPPLSIFDAQARALAMQVRAHPPGARKIGTVATPPSPPVSALPEPTPTRATEGKAISSPPVSPASSSASLSPSVAPVSPPAPAGPPPGVVIPADDLAEDKIRADATGQWAAGAKAKSSYSNPNYGPAKATGAPDVAVAGDSIDAWCPGQQNTGIDWLELAFAKPTRATEVRVRQNHNPGAIVKVEAFEPDGRAHTWWEGTDPYKAPAIRGVAWFAVRVPPTAYPVARIKLTLNLAAVPGWKQIDAVQLVAAP